MYDLNKSQSKVFAYEYLNDFFETNDYKIKKSKNSDLEYIQITQTGRIQFILGFLNSIPGTRINYALYYRNNFIENFLDSILIQINKDYKVDENTHTIGLDYSTYYNISTNNYMPEMVSEADVKKCCDLVIDFMSKIAFPLLQKFEDIKELDREINGEDFWKTDWQMPFSLGLDFPIKRIIIAKIAQNENLNKLINFHIENYNKYIEKGEYVENTIKAKNKFITAIAEMDRIKFT